MNYCCTEFKSCLEDYPGGIHVSEMKKEREIGPFYADVLIGEEESLKMFFIFCPRCGSKLESPLE